MKVLIWAGGLGARISEETSVRPIPMVEIGHKHGVNDLMNLPVMLQLASSWPRLVLYAHSDEVILPVPFDIVSRLAPGLSGSWDAVNP